jgi:hypothetical protein
MLKSSALAELRPLSHEEYVEGFTRKHKPTNYEIEREPTKYDSDGQRVPPRQAANDNEEEGTPSHHEWPARDRLLANELMVGADDAETAMLNAAGLIELRDFMELLRAAAPPVMWWSSEGHENADSGEPYGSGYGADVKRDYGPRPSKSSRCYGRPAPSQPPMGNRGITGRPSWRISRLTTNTAKRGFQYHPSAGQ